MGDLNWACDQGHCEVYKCSICRSNRIERERNESRRRDTHDEMDPAELELRVASLARNRRYASENTWRVIWRFTGGC